MIYPQTSFFWQTALQTVPCPQAILQSEYHSIPMTCQYQHNNYVHQPANYYTTILRLFGLVIEHEQHKKILVWAIMELI